LLYRAFFSSPPLTTREGQPTGALYGFMRMLLRLIDEKKPEYILVALDASGPTFRHEMSSDYKAQRKDMPDDLRPQTKLLRDLLDGLSIARYEHQGYEGDDVLGSLAHMGTQRNFDVIVVTGDGDALQLASDHVTVVLTRRGVSDLDEYSPAEVQTKFGFGPATIPDYKGLRGDASDNIPGVPGIGEKTAMSLLSTRATLEELYENLEDVTPPRIRELLRTHRDAAFHSRELARIITNLEIDVDFDKCRFDMNDKALRESALATVRLFEFKSMISRFSASAANSGDGASTHEEENAPETLLENAPCDVKTARDAAEIEGWMTEHAAPGTPLGFFLEEHRFALGKSGAALIFDGETEAIKAWLEDETQQKIVHDAKSVQLKLATRGIQLRGVCADAMLMGYLLDPTRQQHPMALLCEKYLGRALPQIPLPAPKVAAKKPNKKALAESLFEENENDDAASTREAPEEAPSDEEIAIAGAKSELLGASAMALFDLEPALRVALRSIGEEEIFDELELPMVDVLTQMEQIGMLLDVAQLRALGAKLESDAARLEGEIHALAGEKFNIGSTKQLQTILFEKMALAKGRATKTGYSTDVHTLEKLAEEHEVVRKILEYRGTTKLKSTYVDGLLKGMDEKTHRIHTNLNQTGTVSGRISSSEPNLQNIPIRTEQGRLIRKAFIAPREYSLVAIDYSQVELRILAHITGDAPLVEAFQSGEDVHASTAANLFGVRVEEVDGEMRRKAKMTNYAIAYGVSGFGLQKQLGTGNIAEATEFIKRYFETLPGVKNYIDETLRQARLDGYVKTLMGRRRPLPEIASPRGPERAGAERTAINHPIQGTSADIMKLAMLAIADELRNRKLRARMTMQVHDELVFETPNEEVPEIIEMASRLMCEIPAQKLGLRVPLEVEAEYGSNWNDTDKLEENA
jgi:DNA polymerase-1